MRLTSAAARQSLLSAAFDSGIRHFDVARLYGLGACEGEVGRFAAGRRDQITIATKFGIDPASGLGSLARFQKPVRAFLNRVPAARNAIRRRRDALLAPRSYDAAHAQRSLDVSLRELKVDHIDVLFVHDPGPRDEIHSADLVAFFEAQRRAGKIGAWGVSQDAHPGLDFIGPLGRRALLQVRTDVFASARRTGPYLAFGVLGAAHQKIRATLQNDAALHREWSEVLGLDPLFADNLAELLLADALDANPDGAVLYSTIQHARLPLAARVEADSPRPELRARFRALTTSDRL